MKKILIKLIKSYQQEISVHRPPRCRFYPTCSQYAIEALTMNGLLWGGGQIIYRLLRCQPFAKGGFDPVKKRPLLKDFLRNTGFKSLKIKK